MDLNDITPRGAVTKLCAQPCDRPEQNFRKILNLKGLWLLTRDAFLQWLEDNPFQMGAALAYYTLFSIAPLLLIAIAVAGSVFGREASQDQIIGAIQDLVGFHSARNPSDHRKRRSKAGLRFFCHGCRHVFFVTRRRRHGRPIARLA